jgi:hypothetical protein
MRGSSRIVEVVQLRLARPGRERGVLRQLTDAERVLLAEPEAEPGVHELRIRRRGNDIVSAPAGLDPARRRPGVDIAHVLGVLGGVAGGLHPDVRSPEVVALAHPDDVGDDAAVPGRHRARRVVGAPQTFHFGPGLGWILVPPREQRFRLAVAAMARREELTGGVEVLVREGDHSQSGHRRRTIALVS